ncbi:MAG: hypothetical protein ACRDTC_13445, partial [Pseudonocardiaceae bacterium]
MAVAFKDPETYDFFNFLTLFFGAWFGVIPLVLKEFGAEPWRLAITLYLPAPFDMIASVGAVLAMLGVACGETAPADHPGISDNVIRVTGGEVRGLVDGPVRRFAGIPFAAPPVGPR